MDISIHAAREGGDPRACCNLSAGTRFQSTPPVKAATTGTLSLYEKSGISIHAAREGGDELGLAYDFDAEISIHAAREGGDLLQTVFRQILTIFQSTPPVKAATPQYRHGAGVTAISIHAAREGGDIASSPLTSRDAVFQSTPPVKAATNLLTAFSPFLTISIHAAREGGDQG